MFVYVLAIVYYWLVCIKASDFHMFVHLTRDAQMEVKSCICLLTVNL